MCSRLVLDAALPWSVQTHAFFPAAARAKAVELLLLGHRFCQQPHFHGEERAVFDVWMAHIVPHLVSR